MTGERQIDVTVLGTDDSSFRERLIAGWLRYMAAGAGRRGQDGLLTATSVLLLPERRMISDAGERRHHRGGGQKR